MIRKYVGMGERLTLSEGYVLFPQAGSWRGLVVGGEGRFGEEVAEC